MKAHKQHELFVMNFLLTLTAAWNGFSNSMKHCLEIIM